MIISQLIKQMEQHDSNTKKIQRSNHTSFLKQIVISTSFDIFVFSIFLLYRKRILSAYKFSRRQSKLLYPLISYQKHNILPINPQRYYLQKFVILQSLTALTLYFLNILGYQWINPLVFSLLFSTIFLSKYKIYSFGSFFVIGTAVSFYKSNLISTIREFQ